MCIDALAFLIRVKVPYKNNFWAKVVRFRSQYVSLSPKAMFEYRVRGALSRNVHFV